MNKKRALNVVIALIILFALAIVFFPRIIGSDTIVSDKYDDVIQVTHHQADGSIQQYTGTNFPAPQRGELVEVVIPIKETDRIENPVLCFMYYHAAVEVFFGDELLYTYGMEDYQNGVFIGSVYVQTDLPEAVWGHSVTIRLYPSEGGSQLGLDDITIVPVEKARLYFIKGHEVLYCVFLSLIVLAIIITVMLLASGEMKNSQVRAGIFASLFALLMSLWMFSYYGLNRLLISNQKICGDMEYLLLYLSPAPVSMYMYEIERSRKAKKTYFIAMGIYTIMTIVLTALNYTTPFHFSKTLTIFHVLLAIGCVYIMWSVYSDLRSSNISKVYTRYGMTIMIATVILDLVRFSIMHYTMIDFALLYISLVPVGITLFVACMIYGFVKSFLEGVFHRKEREMLTQLAYTDAMTGLYNRAKYDQKIEEMKEKDATEFAIIFFDLNNLKKANDEYGHNMGDSYIKEVSYILRKTFHYDAFCGRLGGDEFIAIIEGPRCRMVSSYLTEFDEAVAKLDESKTFPFPVYAPHGTAISTKRRILSVDEAVKLADERMYDAKFKSKNKTKEDK